MTMDAKTKERMRHAAEVLQCMADGKDFGVVYGNTLLAPVADVAHMVKCIMSGVSQYRLKPAKTRRPFTEQEARRLVGCVLVDSMGSRSVIPGEPSGATLGTAVLHQWHYHPPGDPDNLKPCWVEE